MNKQLKFSSDGKFKMLLLGDLHEKGADTPEGRAKTEDMLLLLNTSLDVLKPDLVVYMGDICTDFDDRVNADNIVPIIERITKPVCERDLPFAIILGNHEHDGKREDELVARYAERPNCLSFNDDPAITGNLNYNLTVASSDSDKPVFNLWFIDSNNVCEDTSVSVYDWVHRDQIEWYEKKAAMLKEQNGGKVLPSIAFQHIPVTEEYKALRYMKPWELYHSVRGHGRWKACRYMPGDSMTGYLGEGPCAPGFNEGQFESWKKTGDVIGAFFGHDHLNDFTCKVDGIVLGQCKTAGFGCYTDGCRSCVRLVTLDESNLQALETEVYHFKDFGLKCKSLGPIKRTINDKQSIALTVASRAAMGVAAVGGIAFAAKKISEIKK